MNSRKIEYYSLFKEMFVREKRIINGKPVYGYVVRENTTDLFIIADTLIGAYLEYGKHYVEYDLLINLKK